MGIFDKLLKKNKVIITATTENNEEQIVKLTRAEKSNIDKIWACKQYINRFIDTIPVNTDDDHINIWNKGRIHAYQSLLLQFNNIVECTEAIEYASTESEKVRLGEYTPFNSGMYEVYRTFASLDLEQLVLTEKANNKKSNN